MPSGYYDTGPASRPALHPKPPTLCECGHTRPLISQGSAAKATLPAQPLHLVSAVSTGPQQGQQLPQG